MAVKAQPSKKSESIEQEKITAHKFLSVNAPSLSHFILDDKGKPNANAVRDYQQALEAFVKEETSYIGTLLSKQAKESVFTPFEIWANSLVKPNSLLGIEMQGDKVGEIQSGVKSLVVDDKNLLAKSVRAFLSEVTSGVYSSGEGRKIARGFQHRHKGNIHTIAGENKEIEVKGFVSLIARDKTGFIQRMQSTLLDAVDCVADSKPLEATKKCLSQAKFANIDVDFMYRIVNAGVRSRQKNLAMSRLANAQVEYDTYQTAANEIQAAKDMLVTPAPKARTRAASASAPSATV